MKNIILFHILLLGSISCIGQSKMKPLVQLINKKSDTWSQLKSQIKNASNHIQVLPRNIKNADSTLFQAQVTTNSPLGAIIYETGGILIDSGWIRILGSGNKKLHRTIISWNKGKSIFKQEEQPPFLLMADDVIGGLYAINGGGLDSTGIGDVFYFAPDHLKWEDLKMSYSDFLQFCFSGDINKFYEGMRWKTWKKDMTLMNGDQMILFYPFLWSKEGTDDINTNTRSVVPIEEYWNLHFNKK